MSLSETGVLHGVRGCRTVQGGPSRVRSDLPASTPARGVAMDGERRHGLEGSARAGSGEAPLLHSDHASTEPVGDVELLLRVNTVETRHLFIPAFIRTGGNSDRKSTRLNSSHVSISYAVFCLK